MERDQEHDEPGVRAFLLITTISDRASFSGWRIDGRALNALDLFRRGSVFLELPPGAEVVGGAWEPVDSNFLLRRFRVRTGADLRYRIAPSWFIQRAVMLLALFVLPWLLLRPWVSRIEKRRVDDTQKVHLLRSAMLGLSLLAPTVLLLAVFLGGLIFLPSLVLAAIAPGLTRNHVLVTALNWLMLLAVYILALIPGYRVIAPAYRRLRGIKPRKDARERRRKVRIGVAFLAPMFAWLILITALRGAGGWWQLGLELPALVLFLIGGPVLVVRLLPTRAVEGPLRKRLIALAKRAGVTVGDIKVLKTRSDKAANALVIGLIGRGRYVILTDYLIDRFADDEIDAVVGHELGHAKKHHLLLKLGAWFATLLALGALNVGIVVLLGDMDPIWFVVWFPIALLIGLLATQGVLGLVLERRADRFGAELVGKDAMVRALERLAEANMAKRRTGFVWNLLTQHPGLDRRIEELRSSGTADTRQRGHRRAS